MGKEIKVTCDCCGVDIFGKKYFNLCVRKVIHGKQTRNPTATKLAVRRGAE